MSGNSFPTHARHSSFIKKKKKIKEKEAKSKINSFSDFEPERYKHMPQAKTQGFLRLPLTLLQGSEKEKSKIARKSPSPPREDLKPSPFPSGPRRFFLWKQGSNC